MNKTEKARIENGPTYAEILEMDSGELNSGKNSQIYVVVDKNVLGYVSHVAKEFISVSVLKSLRTRGANISSCSILLAVINHRGEFILKKNVRIATESDFDYFEVYYPQDS